MSTTRHQIPTMRYLRQVRLFGMPVLFHWTLPVGAVLVVLWLGAFSPGRALVTVLAYVAIILTHQLGHVWVARAYGLRVHALAILGLGGFCVCDRPTSRRCEMALCFGGIVAQMILLVVALVAGNFTQGLPSHLANDLLFVLTFLNALIVLGNLLPISGTDAGALLRAVYRGAR